MKLPVLVAAGAAALALSASVPAMAADYGWVSVIGDNGGIFVTGGHVTSCTLTDTTAKAEFDVDGTTVSFDLTDKTGTVVIKGEKNWKGTATDTRLAADSLVFTVWGTSSTGETFIANGDCSPVGHP